MRLAQQGALTVKVPLVTTFNESFEVRVRDMILNRQELEQTSKLNVKVSKTCPSID